MSELITNKDAPILRFQNRGAVSFRGRLMFASRAARICEYRADLRKLAEAGHCMPVVARKLGFSVTTIKNWAEILGIGFKKVRSRKCRKYDKSTWESVIVRAAAEGKTQGDVAFMLGVPHVNVHRWCVENGFNWKQTKQDAKAKR
jgi:uncharacterized protein YjcR